MKIESILQKKISQCYKHSCVGDCLEVVAPLWEKEPADQTDPRCIKVPPLVAPGDGKDAWQCLQ